MSRDVGDHHHPSPPVARRLPSQTRPGLSQAERWAGLLVASGRGEHASFELLAWETRTSLRLRALRMSPGVDDADEVVHDSLLQAWCSAGRYDPRRWAASTWLGHTVTADHHIVRSALPSLTDRQRQALRLAYHEGLNIAQAASRLGVTATAMRTRLRSGTARLRGVVRVAEPAPGAPGAACVLSSDLHRGEVGHRSWDRPRVQGAGDPGAAHGMWDR